jgi:CRP-like cAMP-binding protein
MDASLEVRSLARTPVLAGASSEVLNGLAEAATTRTLRRGEAVWHAGELPTDFIVLARGLVKVTRVTPAGKRVFCACFGAPQSIGDAAVIKRIPYPATVSVLTPRALLVCVPAALFMEALTRHPELSLQLAANMREKLGALHDKIDVLSAGAVDARLAMTLLKLSGQYGDELEDGDELLPVPLTRRELSEIAATSLETVVRIMKRWERAGVLETQPQGFVIRDAAALHLALGERAPQDPRATSDEHAD